MLSIVYAYFEISRMIVEEEQHDANRAAYGTQLLKELSAYLTKNFGKGFFVGSLKNIRHFYEILELGTGFAFIRRQERFTFDEEHFMVDLVFCNRLLRCFVLFDLKIGELKRQDIGQMQMYVHYYDRKVKLPDENPTIGIILCGDKNNAVVEMTLPEDNSQIFAGKYETVLPSKEALQKLLQEQIAGEDGGEDEESCNF